MSLGPLEVYQAGLKEGRFHSDAEQLKVMLILQSLFESVMEKLPNSKKFFPRLLFKSELPSKSLPCNNNSTDFS